MIKVIFFDADGTLLSIGSGKIPQSALLSLKKLKERGIKIVLATGRHTNEIKQLPLNGLAFDCYLSLNGQLGLDADFRTLFGTPLCDKAQEELLTMYRQREISLILTTEREQCINYIDDSAARVMKDIGIDVPLRPDILPDVIYQATTFDPPDDADWLRRHCPTGCKITRWGEGAVDILAEDGGKVSGIRKYMERIGLGREEIMAFGDAENDIEMLKFAGVGVAMGNASEEAKAAADYVTAAVEEDGIEKALEHFELI